MKSQDSDQGLDQELYAEKDQSSEDAEEQAALRFIERLGQSLSASLVEMKDEGDDEDKLTADNASFQPSIVFATPKQEDETEPKAEIDSVVSTTSTTRKRASVVVVDNDVKRENVKREEAKKRKVEIVTDSDESKHFLLSDESGKSAKAKEEEKPDVSNERHTKKKKKKKKRSLFAHLVQDWRPSQELPKSAETIEDWFNFFETHIH